MISKVDKALEAANETKALRIGKNNLSEVADMFKEQFPGMTAVVVADTTTYAIAGEKVCNFLTQAGIPQESPFIFTDPALYAEFSFVEQLEASLKQHNAIPIAVGSGTLNDLTKIASHRAGRRYMCVATAASMDGYTAFGASITYEGAKQTLSCPAPQAVLADIEIIKHAPANMTASGYADLLAKITAGADWILSDELGVEPIDDTAWFLVQDGLSEALGDPEGARHGDEKAIDALIEGLVLGGFAMQWSKSSRPASGAEHQFSHLWDMEHHKHNEKSPSHGFKVAIGMLTVTALYEELIKFPMETLDIPACCEKWASEEEAEAYALDLFAGTDFPTIGAQETKAKYIGKEELRKQLEILKEKWPVIKQRLEKQLLPYTEVVRRFKLVGAPTASTEIGITPERLKTSFIRAQHIRRRFTVLDVAVRMGKLDEWIETIFAPDGTLAN